MLLNLSIYNFALIEKLQVGFHAGLNVITGETGAGKSIIIKALEMLLGGRASTEYIRSGQEKAVIEANFSIKDNEKVQNKLKEFGIQYNSVEGIILTREVSHSGNNRSRINGRIVTLDMTRAISQYLIEIHGQHDDQLLFKASNQLMLLDEFAGDKAKGLLEEVGKVYESLKKKKKKFATLNQNEKERARKVDLLKFQIDEIVKAELTKGEMEELLVEKKRLSNAEEMAKVTNQVYNQLYESGFQEMAIVDQLHQFDKDLSTIAELDPKLESIVELLTDATYKLEEVAYELNDYQDGLEFNSQRLNEIEKRIQVINQLKRKYGDNIAEILEYKAEIQAELEELTVSEETLQELEKEIKGLEVKYLEVANQLSNLRKKVAHDFEKKVMSELQDLSMGKSEFEIKLTSKVDNDIDLSLNHITAYGIDNIQFLISPNPGEDLKPLAKIASGGELSRTMLALKKIIAESDQVQTLIFDEVDTGIGGRIANLVGEKLAIIAQSHQVICITHLPQIASMGDTHYYISKDMAANHTKTKLAYLTEEARIKELSRMLGGSSLTDTTREHAHEMIRLARKKKGNF
ncbi:DNA repair protein RecN [Selenihalanaerobacter shriftii]|uniref:DNA repair protein RecN n=1 Tax=Selenihalanaerobacter shriftii TaxID=142842 RepID=A0A1T4P266_9FIRM|nr:DNA repair protein RecN [Selenihalanaerobacter shriftii]SJZ85417.1 DNA repair protein RecN (Recombination protein N) [Selenihalanaerobacter shriftii]